MLVCSCADQINEKIPSKTSAPKVMVIEGSDDPFDSAAVEKGKVLVAYSDCYTCHSVEHNKKGPSFQQIAERYPANRAYIDLLAHKIILGGKGAWGNAVMEPHADISLSNAQLMATYVLWTTKR